MKLQPTSYTFKLRDESGYSFTVTATHDETYGWRAGLYMDAGGMRTAEAAVKKLRYSAEHFLRMLSQVETPTPTKEDDGE